MIRDYFALSFRNLRKRGIRSWLTLLGIFIGIFSVVVLISLSSGIKAAVISQFGVSSTQLISVQAGGISGFGPPGSGVVKPLTKDDAEAIGKISMVEVSLSSLIRPVKIEYNKKLVVGYSSSIDSGTNRDYAYELRNIEVYQGKLLDDTETGKVLLGYDFSDQTKSGFDKAILVGDTLVINGKNFKVAGIIKKQGSFILDRVVFIDESDLRNLINVDESVDIVSVKVKEGYSVEDVKLSIEKLLRERRDVKAGEEDFEISTPESTLKTVNQILSGIQIFIIIIASISIVVGVIGIVNTMTVSVLERRKEIGIMKAVGAKNSHIFYLFFIESGLLGLIGGLAGVIMGKIIGYIGIFVINNYLGASIKPTLDLLLIISALFGSFLIGSIAGILPALNAAKQNPVEVLRG
ncbi:MAG TPA: ABC transporter permease [Candidatus Paceibacterota bacterium]|nr:ABC transporter permease [Candidatus Paceibacterota bacterium]